MNGNILALFGAVAVLLTVTVAMTLSRAAPVASSSFDALKCYELTRLIETPCDQPPRIIQTSGRSARSD
jgi:hypothetical protein